jgi:hypothetical protein
MIVVKDFETLSFETKKDMYKAYRENKDSLYAIKKKTFKQADAVHSIPLLIDIKGKATKANSIDVDKYDVIQVEPVISTTGILDSHLDVHIKGCFNKTVKDPKIRLHLQEHNMTFDKIIADGQDVSASVQQLKWRDLGFNIKGDTEALVYKSIVRKRRNEYMFNQYAKGFVRNHSIGMQYIKLHLCLNSDSKYDVEERDNWEKYIDEITFNKDEAEELGVFWAVTELKEIEGSAVVKGSNIATPNQSIEAVNDTSNKANKADVNHFDLAKRIKEIEFNI